MRILVLSRNSSRQDSRTIPATVAVWIGGRSVAIDNGTFAPPTTAVTSADVGTTGAAGSAALSNGTYTIQGAGTDIEDSADSFHFLYKSLAGDGQIVARIVNVTETNPWTEVGVIVRDSLAPGSKNAFMLLRPSLGSAFQYRAASNSPTQSSWQEEPNEGSA